VWPQCHCFVCTHVCMRMQRRAKWGSPSTSPPHTTTVQEAADLADPVQMGLVGLMLQQGWGCDRNECEAQKWLAAAARHGADMPPGYKPPPGDMPPPVQLAHLGPPGAALPVSCRRGGGETQDPPGATRHDAAHTTESGSDTD
jgi:hypothetical protein